MNCGTTGGSDRGGQTNFVNVSHHEVQPQVQISICYSINIRIPHIENRKLPLTLRRLSPVRGLSFITAPYHD
jgi:hypothetical protein